MRENKVLAIVIKRFALLVGRSCDACVLPVCIAQHDDSLKFAVLAVTFACEINHTP